MNVYKKYGNNYLESPCQLTFFISVGVSCNMEHVKVHNKPTSTNALFLVFHIIVVQWLIMRKEKEWFEPSFGSLSLAWMGTIFSYPFERTSVRQENDFRADEPTGPYPEISWNGLSQQRSYREDHVSELGAFLPHFLPSHPCSKAFVIFEWKAESVDSLDDFGLDFWCQTTLRAYQK